MWVFCKNWLLKPAHCQEISLTLRVQIVLCSKKLDLQNIPIICKARFAALQCWYAFIVLLLEAPFLLFIVAHVTLRERDAFWLKISTYCEICLFFIKKSLCYSRYMPKFYDSKGLHVAFFVYIIQPWCDPLTEGSQVDPLCLPIPGWVKEEELSGKVLAAPKW